MRKKVLVTISFVVSDYPEEELGPLVTGIEQGITESVERALSGFSGADEQLLASAIEFYGATVTLQQPLLRQ